MRLVRPARPVFFRDPVAYADRHRADGDLLLFHAGLSEFRLVRDPEAIRTILVADAASYRQGKWKRRARRLLGETLNVLDGPAHRERRLLLQPSLDRRRIATFAPSIVARTVRREQGWRDGTRLDVRGEVDQLSLEAVAEALFSTELEGASRELARALAVVIRAVPGLRRPLPGTSLRSALDVVDRACGSILAERREGGERGDLVDALAASGLSERARRREMATFLLAAVDEPPSALVSAWWLLDRNPEARERLEAELDLGLGGRLPELADLAHLPYLDAVLMETLRLAPPVRHVDRCPRTDVRIGGQAVPAGADLLISPLVTHRDPRFFEEPERFVPDRWLDHSRTRRPRFAFVPFGAGPHTCIGEALATSLIALVLAVTCASWRLRVDPDVRLPDSRSPGLPVTLERR